MRRAFDIDAIRAISERHGILKMLPMRRHLLQKSPRWLARHVPFSFHAIKNMTCAEGGLVVTDDEQLAQRIRSLKFHGLGVDAYDRQTHGRAAGRSDLSGL
jgi:UDP-4-amino-4-deoxy-L-arabinose-oxoglutarate aminotransferase